MQLVGLMAGWHVDVTELLKSTQSNIKRAAEVIRSGGLVAFPTETVYGLGADATNEQAVATVFAAKGRPPDDPIIVHIASREMLPVVAREIPEMARRLIDRFWPGPLTLVLKKTDRIPGIVTAGLPTVAVRMPENDIALALIREAGVPVAAPSANRFGRPSPTCAAHVMDDLAGKIDLVLDGGPTRVGVESTVLDLTVSPPAILRPGGISREALEELLGTVTGPAGEAGRKGLKSPGRMKKHYAPRATVLLFAGDSRGKVVAAMKERIGQLQGQSRIGVLAPEEEAAGFAATGAIVAGLGSYDTLEEVARRLFEVMRTLDAQGVDYIFALAPPQKGIGLAVFDRLYKAAGSRLVRVD